MQPMRDLILRHLHGEIDAKGFARLQAWVESDSAHGQEYLRMVADERALEKLIVQHELSDIVDLHDETSLIRDPAPFDLLKQIEADATPELVDLTQEIHDRQQLKLKPPVTLRIDRTPQAKSKVIVIPKALVWSGLAAAAVLLAIVLWPGHKPQPQSDIALVPAPSTPTPHADTPSVPDPAPLPAPRIATLTGMSKAVWGRGQAPVTGQPLLPGDYHLRRGWVQCTFGSGAIAVIHGPTEFSLDAENQIVLTQGQLVVRCDSPASKGFTVWTPSARITDLGTEFTVEHDQAGTTRTQVMQGKVELAPNIPNAAGLTSLLSQGQAAQVATDSARIQRVAYASDQFTTDWAQLIRQPVIQGQARFVFVPPASVGLDTFESDPFAAMLLEKFDHTLTTDLTVSFSQPGSYSVPVRADWRTLPAGTRVDSYLLHFDPIGEALQPYSCDATIIFDRPVLAVIATGLHMTRSDVELGRPSVRYDSDFRPNENRDARSLDDNNDQVILSDDRRAITVRMAATTGMDQLRILVQPLTTD